MAQPTKKGSQLSPVGHEMIGETLGTPILQCGLLQEIEVCTKKTLGCVSTGVDKL